MANQIEGLTETDRMELRGLVEEHQRRTGSTVALHLLEDWDEEVERFVKVFPIDYKRVLAELDSDQDRSELASAGLEAASVATSSRKEI
jgi:glutamate synthase domain-containing protein 3